METLSGHSKPKPGQIGHNSILFSHELADGYDLETDQGAYQYARELTVRTVKISQLDMLTKASAIQWISIRYQLNSFVERLWKGKNASIVLSKIKRLERAHDEVMRSLPSRDFGT